MKPIVKNIRDAETNGTINIYAMRYAQQKKDENIAVALPGNLNIQFRKDFCNNIIKYENAIEKSFNPIIDGLEDGTYEYVSLEHVRQKWNEIEALINNANSYNGNNKKLVSYSNMFICAMDYDGVRYYFLAKQKNTSEKILKGKCVFWENQDKLKLLGNNEVFVLNSYVGVIVDLNNKKVLIFDKKIFQQIFKYDDYQKEKVKNNIHIIDDWKFLLSTDLIKEKCSQKNVYSSLAVVFEDENYLKQIKETTPVQLKKNLLARSSNNFTENDFDGDKLKVTSKNINIVMKMLAKGFKFNFFTNNAEQL
mgnify:CR=1 FL=1